MKQPSAARLLVAALINLSYLLFGGNYAALQAQPSYTSPADIPAEAFAALPLVQSLRQSPDGKKVAYISSIEGRKVVIVQNLDGSDRYIQPPIEDADIFAFRWANKKRLLIMYELAIVRNEYVSFRNTESRLAAVNADGSNMEWIVRPSKVKNGSGLGATEDNPMWQTEIIDMLPDDPNHILLSVDGDFNGQDEIRKIDIRNGRFTELEDGFRGVQHWITDKQGEPRFGWGVWQEENIAYWKTTEGDWVQVTNQDWYRKYNIFGFDDTPNHMIVSAPTKHGTKGVFRLNIETGALVEELFAHEAVDIDWVLRPREGNAVVGVGYTADQTQYHYFDKKRAQLDRVMRKALDGYNISITDYDAEAGRYLIFAYNDTEPGIYFQFDRKAKRLAQVTAVRPGLPPELMSSTKRVNVTAKDGTVIPTYLTLPNGKPPKNLPAIVLVHGGPYARDDASWDYWAQFLASRGYAVLKPNFRGSDGYGEAFLRAGYNQWGGLMQTDVEDATRQMITEGIFDPERICIAGASYGGYAAMTGIIQTPSLYQCGVSINGAVNLPRLKNADAVFWGTRRWLNTIGLEGADDQAVSPFHQVDKINQPVLLMASRDDTRLKIVDTENFHSRLKSSGKNSTYVEIEDGGHSMDTMNARLKKLTAMEAFLAKHIGD